MRMRGTATDIDLLAAYNNRNIQFGQSNKKIKLVLPIVILVVLVAGIFGYLKIRNNQLATEIADYQDKIIQVNKEAKNSGNAKKSQTLAALQKTNTDLKALSDNINSYPKLSTNSLQGLLNATTGVEVTELDFDQTKGTYTVSIKSEIVIEPESIVRTLKATGLFESVKYTGYNRTSESTTTDTTLSEGTSNEAVATEAQTANYYISTIICVLKVGV